MLNLTFAATCAASGITPVVFGDEFLVRAVFDMDPRRCEIDFVAHGQRNVGLAVHRSRDEGDSPPGDYLTDEDHTAPPAVGCVAADVESEIHLLEVAVEGDRTTEHPGVQETKSDDAQEGLAFAKVQLCSVGDKWL